MRNGPAGAGMPPAPHRIRLKPLSTDQAPLMSQHSLQTIIDQAWDNRAELSPKAAPRDVREAVGHALAELDKGHAARGPEEGRRLGRQPMGPRRPCCCRSGSRTMPRCPPAAIRSSTTGTEQVRVVHRGRFRGRRLSRRAARDRAPRFVHRPQCRADALVRQYRGVCRRRHDGRYLGDGRLVRADRQERPSVGRCRHRRRASSRCRRTP